MNGFAEKHADSLGITLHRDVKNVATFGGFSKQRTFLAEGDFSYHFGDSTFVNYNNTGYMINPGKTIKDFANVLSNDEIKSRLPGGVDGIMPLKCFSKNGIIKINFEKNRIEFPTQVNSSAVSYPYELIDGNIQVVNFPITFLNNWGDRRGYTMSSIMDLGYTGSFSFYNKKKFAQMLSEIKSYSQNSSSTYKDYGYSRYCFDSLRIGKDNMLVEGACFLNIDFLDFTNFDALVGMEILSGYDLWFDYKEQIIYMKPLSAEIDMNSKNVFSILFGFGFGLQSIDNSTYYYAMSINHDKAKTDIMLRDILLKIDDVNVVNISQDSLRSIMSDKSIPQESITIKRGADTLVLKRIKD